MHVQSCCFANLNLLLFRDPSRCLRRVRFKDLCFNLVPRLSLLSFAWNERRWAWKRDCPSFLNYRQLPRYHDCKAYEGQTVSQKLISRYLNFTGDYSNLLTFPSQGSEAFI